MDLLIIAGVDVNLPSNSGKTPFMMEASYDHANISLIEKLLIIGLFTLSNVNFFTKIMDVFLMIRRQKMTIFIILFTISLKLNQAVCTVLYFEHCNYKRL